MGDIAEARETDLGWMTALNNAATPHVNALSGAALGDLVRQAAVNPCARLDGMPVGFLLALGAGADYRSLNYRWFSARYADFLYVDRIVVAAPARGRGIARALYGEVFAAAGDRPVCCEVNLRPANAVSLRFHLSLGLAEVGRQKVGDKLVALLSSLGPSR